MRDNYLAGIEISHFFKGETWSSIWASWVAGVTLDRYEEIFNSVYGKAYVTFKCDPKTKFHKSPSRSFRNDNEDGQTVFPSVPPWFISCQPKSYNNVQYLLDFLYLTI